MTALFLKEIKDFFNSLIGYLVIVVYLIVNSLFMWIFPGNFNVFDIGFANLDSLFLLSPWIFLFLVPAITMNMFANEFKTGTMELLLTRPLSELQIVLSKYFSTLVLVLISILPTLLFVIPIYYFSTPVGNIDTGALIGSYIGLFLLAASYSAVGLFASSLSKSTIIAFILSILICYFFYLGFNNLAYLDITGKIAGFISYLGISEHYTSISRGIVDSRDVFYFLTLIALFIFLTKLRLESRKW